MLSESNNDGVTVVIILILFSKFYKNIKENSNPIYDSLYMSGYWHKISENLVKKHTNTVVKMYVNSSKKKVKET